MTTGTLLNFLISLQTSNPSIDGSITSRMTASNPPSRAIASPSLPSVAVIRRNLAALRPMDTISRIEASSSTSSSRSSTLCRPAAFCAVQPGLAQLRDVLPQHLLKLPGEIHDQPELVVAVVLGQPLPRLHHRQEYRCDIAKRPLGHEADHHPPPIRRVTFAPDEARLFEPVDHAGDRCRAQSCGLRELTRGHLAAEAQQVQGVQIRGVDPDPVSCRLPHQLHERAGTAQ